MLIKFEDGKMKVQSDYNKKFISRARGLQGKWNAPFWEFPKENEDMVREALMEAYGEDGKIHKTVIVDLELDKYEYNDKINIGEITIAKRRFRDEDVKLDKRAAVVKGGFCESGGSKYHPRVTHENGTVLRVKDVPEKIYEEIKDITGVTKVDIEQEENREEKKAALTREREAIIKRLAEINAQLEAYA